MTNFADEYPGEKLTVHIDHAAAVTARMPTAEECAVGYLPDVPLLIVADGGINGKVFSARLVALTFDDPHEQPEPDAVKEAAAYVLGIISEELSGVLTRIDAMANAVRRSPCSIAHLAGEISGKLAAAFSCPDGICEQNRAAVSAT